MSPVADRLASAAFKMFGDLEPGYARVQAMSDWIHDHVEYRTGSTDSTTTACDVFLQRAGVCRDFAHLGITFCRALNIPARYVFGYLPEIEVPALPEPMDFAAWFEVYLDHGWQTFDARNNMPRIGRVLIARGRDATDVALSDTFGPNTLTDFRVWTDEVQVESGS